MITKEQVFQALTTYGSAEGDAAAGCVVYYLHISKSGEIFGDCTRADKTFTYEIRDEDNYFRDTKNADKQKVIDEIQKRIFDAWEKRDFDAAKEAQEELEMLDDGYSMEDYFDKERSDDPDFMAIVESLTDQANAYLESN